MYFTESHLQRLFELARACIANGNRPMPAMVIWPDGSTIEAMDAVFEAQDPTMHGEIAAIRKACSQRGTLSLKGAGMLCFGEPCLMCCGAIHWARLDWVAYCLPQGRLQALSGGRPKPGIRAYLPLGSRKIDIVGPVFENEAFTIAAQYDWKGNA